MSNTSKRCNKCKRVKALDEFHRHACRKDGRKSACKACTIAINHEYHSRHEVKLAMKEHSEKRKPSEDDKQARSKAREEARKAYRGGDEYKALVAERKERERRRAVMYAQTRAFKDRDKDKFKKHRDSLSDEYIKRQLSKGAFAIPRCMMTNDLIELKRVHLELKRTIRELA